MSCIDEQHRMPGLGDGAVILGSRTDVTLEAYEAVSWQGKPASISKAALARIASSRELFLKLIEDPEVSIYGVTTGYGQYAKKRLSFEERKRQAATPPLAVDTAFGSPLPERIVRGIILARLANFLDGHAGVSADLAVSVAKMLEAPIPEVSSEGIGCAGEIQPLGQLFKSLCTNQAMGEKESLALVNGSPAAAALLADRVLAAERRLSLAGAVFALSCEAILAPMGPFDPRLAELWGNEDEAAALSALGYFLK
ncbi:MAG: aromatic amino acid lyase, partial [Kiloniellales bacterium]|nr:aromatic amino acid lyase [Kiloniellales bacterium]